MPITETDLDDLLSVAEVAAILHLSPATTYRILDSRELDTIRLGNGRGRRYVTRRALLDYVNRSVERRVERPAS